jgi:hypothetical protein
MKSLKQSCTPRPSVFDASKRDIVLDVSDLIQDRIKAHEFFEENYLTDGMTTLLRESFRRFERKSAQGVFRLTQAMGGGKTHNLLVLGLLAKHPEYRAKVMRHIYEAKDLGPVRVVAFSGRESDAPYGVWGAIAEQLGKKEVFKDYYAPLSAPGQTAWINLLKGDPLLILLDELPPYLQNARSIAVGHSDLSEVTTTALANLLVAVGKDELANVCIVLSDLRAMYEQGSQLILKALQNLEQEIGRSALSLEPVGMNTDELYHILRKRIFVSLPSRDDVKEVAAGYARAVKEAKQMDITNASPEQFASQVMESYPFHPAIRDLYARFRENPGFQQTRGLIRLMRIIVSRLFEPGGRADKTYLISPHDFDLNDRETLAEITLVNPTVENAIGHDIASGGKAVAEIMDANLGSTDSEDICKLLLVASLANIPNAVLGLSISEVASYLCSPGRDLTKVKEILGILATKAWYLHSNKEGKLFFKNVQNLVAKLKTTAESYNRESSLKELKTRLADMFAPALKDCYQEVVAFPAVDEISIKPEKVLLIVSEPVSDGPLHKDLIDFYNNLEYKNRVLFLTGQRGTLDILLETAAELKAISAIIAEMTTEGTPPNDPQFIAAVDLQDKITHRLLSASRETFTTLVYPHMDGLKTADFLMNFTDNSYKGEQQIKEALKGKQKFTEDITSDSFRKKCEERLFTQKVMAWTEVKKRAATNIKWQWHKPDALDGLKFQLVFQDKWREQGGYVEKPPFPQPRTEVRVKEVSRNDDTGVAVLRLIPVNGDTLHYEIGGPATPASLKVTDANKFETDELEVFFLCVDSRGEHETGENFPWKNRITLKWRSFQNGPQKMVELRSAPKVPIRYTTDGSDPKTAGGVYDTPFLVPKGTVCVLAYAEKNGVASDVCRWDIDWKATSEVVVDKEKPAIWRRTHHPSATKESYEFLERTKKHEATLCVPHITVAGKNWIELQVDDKVYLTPDQIEKTLEHLRGLLTDGQVDIEARALRFDSGQKLLDWVAEAKTEIKPGEVEQ